MQNYRGRIFAQNTTGVKSNAQNVVFTCRNDRPGMHIQEGLFNPNFSGLVALNLAIISGANPIYLIGYGMGKDASISNFHYKQNYTAATHNKQRYNKYINVQRYYNAFRPFRDRVVHVSDGKDMVQFKKQPVKKFKKMRSRKLVIEGRLPRIAHMSFTNDVQRMGDVSRGIINRGYGKHTLHDFKKGIPNADFYILEHFLSTHRDCVLFPYKQKAIDIVHTQNCIPKGNYYKIITLTNAWKNQLQKHGIQNVQVIYGGIDLDPYENITPDYENNVFGRITRWSPGKIPPNWNAMLQYIFRTNKNIKCLMFTDFVNKSRKKLAHPQMIYDETVKIADFKGDALKQLSLYVHANGYFKETLSHAIIEAMATGLPIIYLTEGTGVLQEVTGAAGIHCKNMSEVQEKILRLIGDPTEKERIGKLAKQQAKKFHIKNTVQAFDNLIRSAF
jgi:glycosyltransferase involved in cell wall biosynthesis